MNNKEEINNKAIELAKRISLLKDIEAKDWGKEMTFTDFCSVYLGDIPLLVQNFINEAYESEKSDPKIKKVKLLNNFIGLCKLEGVSSENPFIIFIMDDKNFREILENKF